MNHEQWTALQAATKGHTPGPYRVHGWEPRGEDGEVWEHYLTSANGHRINKTGNELAASASDLLEEIKRLRAWLAHVSVCAEWVCSGAATGIYVTEIVDAVTAALNGEVVPEKEDK